jgi:hypothetical protein
MWDAKRSVADANMKQAVTFWPRWTVTNTKKNCNEILMMEIDGKVTTHHQTSAEECNNY